MRLFLCFLKMSLIFVAVAALTAAVPQQACANSGAPAHGKPKEEAKGEAKSKKKDATTITGGTSKDDPIFLHMAPVTLPIINDFGAQQLVTMLIDLQIDALENAEKMQKEMPRLKDAILQALYGGLADGSMRNANALDIVKIKSNVQTTLNRIFGGDHVSDVLIQGVSQRKL